MKCLSDLKLLRLLLRLSEKSLLLLKALRGTFGHAYWYATYSLLGAVASYLQIAVITEQ